LLVWCLGDFAKRWPTKIKISYDIMTFSRLRAKWLQFNCQLSSITFNNNMYSALPLCSKIKQFPNCQLDYPLWYVFIPDLGFSCPMLHCAW
jgi:hypothetical protein